MKDDKIKTILLNRDILQKQIEPFVVKFLIENDYPKTIIDINVLSIEVGCKKVNIGECVTINIIL